MNKVIHKPAFITFTGIDDAALIKGMVELSKRFPIEWGILIDRHKKGVPLFPDGRQVDSFRECGVRLCAHICGDIAQEIVRGLNPSLNLAGFSRIQVNHSREGARPEVVRAVSRFSARHGVRGVLQCRSEFPVEENGVDWLYDVSFGEGVRPKSFPTVRTDQPFCGISGGIDSNNVADLLANTISVEDGQFFWIDMESGVRTDGSFDLEKCEAVCRAVYG